MTEHETHYTAEIIPLSDRDGFEINIVKHVWRLGSSLGARFYPHIIATRTYLGPKNYNSMSITPLIPTLEGAKAEATILLKRAAEIDSTQRLDFALGEGELVLVGGGPA